MLDTNKAYSMPPTDILLHSLFPVTSLLLLSDLHVHNLLLITQCDGHPMLCNEPQSLKLADSNFSPFVFIYLFSKNSPAVSPWGDASGECLFVVTDQQCSSCVMCFLG